MAVERFKQLHDKVLLMKNDLRVQDVLVYFIICHADLSLIKRTFLQKLQLGIAGDTSEGSVHFGHHISLLQFMTSPTKLSQIYSEL